MACFSFSFSFSFVEGTGIAAFYWIDEEYACALVALLKREPLLRIAYQVYRDIKC
jgi:anti-sigma factor RsiW